jgi:uncharacterized membrane protein (DUF441 family)
VTKRTRRWLVVAAVVFAALAAFMLVAMVGTGVAALGSSSCKRDCDGTGEMYAACVFGGLSLASLIGAGLAAPRRN